MGSSWASSVSSIMDSGLYTIEALIYRLGRRGA